MSDDEPKEEAEEDDTASEDASDVIDEDDLAGLSDEDKEAIKEQLECEDLEDEVD